MLDVSLLVLTNKLSNFFERRDFFLEDPTSLNTAENPANAPIVVQAASPGVRLVFAPCTWKTRKVNQKSLNFIPAHGWSLIDSFKAVLVKLRHFGATNLPKMFIARLWYFNTLKCSNIFSTCQLFVADLPCNSMICWYSHYLRLSHLYPETQPGSSPTSSEWCLPAPARKWPKLRHFEYLAFLETWCLPSSWKKWISWAS